jgi:MoaA/NifB/PqqE/SkfB family radical SAM enzyme
MSRITFLKSQWNNLSNFRTLFPLRTLVRIGAGLPRDYLSRSGHAGPPMVMNILVTSRCNMNCDMCSTEPFRGVNYVEMSPGDLDRIVTQTLSWRPTFFFGGGEPFVRNDMLEMVEVVKRHGLPLGMVTNGLRVTPEVGDSLKSLGLNQIIFSLHGPNGVHDHITRTPGAFDRVSKNIEAFCRGPRKTRVMMNVVPSVDNLDHLEEMVEIGRSLGVDKVRIEHLVYLTHPELAEHHQWCSTHLPGSLARGFDVNAHVCSYATLDQSSERIIDILSRIRKRHGDFLMIKPILGEDEIRSWYAEGHTQDRSCFFVWRSTYIDPEGYVLPCLFYTDMKFGNVLHEPLLEIWNSPRYREARRILRDGLLPGCTRCCRL